MKILHVTSGIDDHQGGTTAALLAIAEAQQQIGLDVAAASVFGLPFHGTSAEKLRASGVPLTLIGPNRPGLADRCRAFAGEQYDRLALARNWRGHYQQLIDSHGKGCR